MKYPKLVPPRVCTTPVTVTLYGEGIGEDGEPQIVFHAGLYCNFQDCAKTVFTSRQKKVEATGKALFDGDICPSQAAISGGYLDVFGARRTIVKGVKARNPDGTVNYTELDVM